MSCEPLPLEKELKAALAEVEAKERELSERRKVLRSLAAVVGGGRR